MMVAMPLLSQDNALCHKDQLFPLQLGVQGAKLRKCTLAYCTNNLF